MFVAVFVVVELGAGGCTMMPTRATRVHVQPVEPLIGAGFSPATVWLATRGDLPVAGSDAHDELRRFIVAQMNDAAGAKASARVSLPTVVVLTADGPLFSITVRTLVPAASSSATPAQEVTTTHRVDRRPRPQPIRADRLSRAAGLVWWPRRPGPSETPIGILGMMARREEAFSVGLQQALISQAGGVARAWAQIDHRDPPAPLADGDDAWSR